MSQYGSSSDADFVSFKKGQEVHRDLMAPGNGTPWEDRGAIGLFPAFFKTCIRTLTMHGRLLDHIRRPETTHEARRFAAGCAILWSVSVGIWNVIRYFYYSHQPALYDVSGQQFLIESLVQSALVFGLVMLLLTVSTGIYKKLLAGANTKRIPPVLVFNVLAYSLGASVLAIVPVIGWVAAAAAMLVDVIIAGQKRLYLKFRDALANACIVFFVGALILLGTYFAWWLVWNKVLSGQEAIATREPKALHHVVPRD